MLHRAVKGLGKTLTVLSLILSYSGSGQPLVSPRSDFTRQQFTLRGNQAEGSAYMQKLLTTRKRKSQESVIWKHLKLLFLTFNFQTKDNTSDSDWEPGDDGREGRPTRKQRRRKERRTEEEEEEDEFDLMSQGEKSNVKCKETRPIIDRSLRIVCSHVLSCAMRN